MRSLQKYVVAVSAAVLVLASLTLTQAGAQGAAPDPAGRVVPLRPATEPDAGSMAPVVFDKLVHAPESRFVDIDVAEVHEAVAGGSVQLDLFDGVTVSLAGPAGFTSGEGGSVTWSGVTPEGGVGTLTVVKGQLLASVFVGGVRYDVQPVEGATHLVTEEGRAFPDEHHGEHPEGEEHGSHDVGSGSRAPMTGEEDHGSPIIRVLTWYDTAARNYFGGDAASQSELTATINELNAAYERSGVHQRVESAGIEYVDYTGSGNSSTELNRVSNASDGYLDAIHTRRDQTEADLVAFITMTSDGFCGIAWLPGSAPSAATQHLAFSVTAANCARGNLTFAHEMAHNMGAGHGMGDGAGTFSYSNGYRNEPLRYRTIMAYNSSSCGMGSCTRVPYFSSPTVLYTGNPTGSATQDNARTLNETAAAIAAYRGGTAPPTPPPNDNFANAISVTTPATVSGTNVNGTKQAGEPNHAGVTGGASVWWRFVAPWTGPVQIDTLGSSFDTVLGVYTGTAVNALTEVASNDDCSGCGFQSRVSFTATSGTTYRVAVDGFGGATGTVNLAIRTAPGPPTTVTGVPGAGSATVSWTAPGNTGGHPVTGYTVTASPGGQTCTAPGTSCTVSGLTDGTAYTFSVRATNVIGTGPASAASAAVTPGVRFVGVTPKRLLDSRDGTGGYNTPWGAGTERTLPVRGGTTTVPANATAVVLNVTAVNPSAGTHLTVWPNGASRPVASNLNIPAGEVRPNLVVVAVGSADAVRIFNNSGSVHVIADVVGYFAPGAAGGRYTGVTPKRLLDSRDGTGGYATPWGPYSTRTVTVRGGTTTVPADATGVILNVTVTNPSQATHLTVWPTGASQPVASNLNLVPGQTAANLVMVGVGTNGQVSIFNNAGTAHVIADVVGYYRPDGGAHLTGVTPKRLLDSRDGTGGYATAWGSAATRTLTVRGGTTTVPGDATAVVINLTGISPTQATHLTVWPAGEPMPVASNLNLPAGDVRPNLVVVKVGTNGQINIYNNSGNTHVVADVVAYFR